MHVISVLSEHMVFTIMILFSRMTVPSSEGLGHFVANVTNLQLTQFNTTHIFMKSRVLTDTDKMNFEK